ncbi:hypothetical protein JCM3770_003370 [Rhodotorula araucariae]
MAKGLFAVYRDAAPSSLPSGSQCRAPTCAPNKARAHRKDTAPSTRHEGGLRARTLGEKENVDPAAARVGGKDALAGKARKPALGAKRADAEGCGGKGARASLPRGLGGQGATNGVCTGTLRTRVLPDLPPLEPEADVERVVPAPPPATIDVHLDAENRSPRTSGNASFLSASTGSASDSGYARSSSAHARDTELDFDMAAAFADEGNAERSHELQRAMTDREADRRARALTESPLAEITQAFTGLGRFSVANMSPSPSVRPSTSRPAPPPRTRSSPSKAPSLSALPIRMAPYAYSTTATTKRAKPGPPAAASDKPRGAAPLRF